MELNHLEVTAAPRAAASVVMLRDAPGGMEVLLLKRKQVAFGPVKDIFTETLIETAYA